MNEMQIFNNEEFGEVRTVTIDGEVWFVGRDVAAALGYAKPEGAVRNYVSEKDTLKWGILSNGGNQQTIIINEAGLYALIFGSKLESARRFQDWVTHDVLPSIRKTGSYTTGAALPTDTRGQLRLLMAANEETNQRIDRIEQDFAAFRDDLPLFPKELEQINKAVKAKGMEVVGGKDSPAYVSCYRMVVRDIYGELWREFNVTSYKDIPRCYIDKVPGVIEKYTPPIFLADRITEAA